MPASDLTPAEKAFLKEAEEQWGVPDASIARWSFEQDLSPSERRLLVKMSTKVNAKAKKPTEKSDLFAYRALVKPVLKYGFEEQNAPLRKIDRLAILHFSASTSLVPLSFSFSRHPWFSFGLCFLDRFFSMATVALLCIAMANQNKSMEALYWYLGWAACLLFTIFAEQKVKSKSWYTPSGLLLRMIFPLLKEKRESLEGIKKTMDALIRKKIKKEEFNPEELSQLMTPFELFSYTFAHSHWEELKKSAKRDSEATSFYINAMAFGSVFLELDGDLNGTVTLSEQERESLVRNTILSSHEKAELDAITTQVMSSSGAEIKRVRRSL